MPQGVTNSQGQIQERSDFKKDKQGLYEYYDAEMQAFFDAVKKWQKQGNKTVDRFLDRRGAGEENWFRLNLYHSNITTLRSMLFGKLPDIDVNRSNDDFNDDVARVAAFMLRRMLQNDIGTPNDEYSDSLRMNLDDRLIPGLGVSRVRYEFDKKTNNVATMSSIEGKTLAEGYTEDVVTGERAPIEYVHWRDFAWSPARTWAEVRWVAFKAHMTRDQLVKRFGEKIGKKIPLTESVTSKEEKQFTEQDDPKQDAWMRASIWEIWDKQTKKVFWWCKDFPEILDDKPDPLKLAGFWPIPKPMVSNVTTTAWMPIPDFVMAQDLYNEIDKLETRISLITDAVKVVGVYDKSSEGVKRMLVEGVENDLIPVDNWALFAEKGGLQGQIDWLPFDTIAGVLAQLTARRQDATQLLYEITGMSDVMRGAQSAGGAVTATERSLQARFASVRIQALQDEFSNYATDLIRLRAEVISKHFSVATIIKQSNIETTADAALGEQAAALIKDTSDLVWRITVKPESVAMVDYAQLKEERTSYITALATFMQSAAPLVELDPGITPSLLSMLQWGLAGFKGSEEVEGILDQAIDEARKNLEQPEGGSEGPSPEEIKAQAEQAKSQAQMQLEQIKHQHAMELIQAKMQSDMQEFQAEMQVKMQEIEASTQQDIIKEQAQMEANKEEESHETEEFIKREQARARINKRSDNNGDST